MDEVILIHEFKENRLVDNYMALGLLIFVLEFIPTKNDVNFRIPY